MLAEGAGDGPNAPWARFGRSGIDPWRDSRNELRDERVEALGATGTPRHAAARRGARGARDGVGIACGGAPIRTRGERRRGATARRLHRAGAPARGRVPGRTNAAGRAGRVLFDDVDKHLHPGTQQRVVPMLHRTFPGTQFIGTTQSPVVLTTLHPRQITRLTRQGSKSLPQE